MKKLAEASEATAAAAVASEARASEDASTARASAAEASFYVVLSFCMHSHVHTCLLFVVLCFFGLGIPITSLMPPRDP